LIERQRQLVALLPTWEKAEVSGIFTENIFLDYFLKNRSKESDEIFQKVGNIKKIGEMFPENNFRGSFILPLS
jgi:hypothetical protein